VISLRKLAATGCGTGFVPKASGTFGTLFGVAIQYLLFKIGIRPSINGSFGYFLAVAAVIVLGLWSARTGLFERKDDQRIVIDEIAGYLTGFLFAPYTPFTVTAGFILFRIFDIYKPGPIRKLEELPSSVGVMADDIMSGICTNVVLLAICRIILKK